MAGMSAPTLTRLTGRAAMNHLARLGPDGIAAAARADGIRARRCDAVNCPVARLFAALTGYEGVSVGTHGWAGVDPDPTLRDDGAETAWYVTGYVPDEVLEFIRAFDGLAYPDLVLG